MSLIFMIQLILFASELNLRFKKEVWGLYHYYFVTKITFFYSLPDDIILNQKTTTTVRQSYM